MEGLLGFFENEFGPILILVGIVVIVGFFLRIAWKMNKKLDPTGEESMSTRQMAAANKAVKKLEKAARLLKEGDENLEEAIRLRDEALGEDLPPQKVVIKGEDPRSLLLAVNKRIDGAESRSYVKEARAAQHDLERGMKNE